MALEKGTGPEFRWREETQRGTETAPGLSEGARGGPGRTGTQWWGAGGASGDTRPRGTWAATSHLQSELGHVPHQPVPPCFLLGLRENHGGLRVGARAAPPPTTVRWGAGPGADAGGPRSQQLSGVLPLGTRSPSQETLSTRHSPSVITRCQLLPHTPAAREGSRQGRPRSGPQQESAPRPGRCTPNPPGPSALSTHCTGPAAVTLRGHAAYGRDTRHRLASVTGPATSPLTSFLCLLNEVQITRSNG